MRFKLDNGQEVTTTEDACKGWSGQDRDGYGRKIRTHYMATVQGRARRVYLCQYGMTGAYYVNVKGAHVYIRPFAF